MRFFSWLGAMFSENGTPSFSRVASMLHSLAVIGWGTHFAWHAHQCPDAVTLGGLAAFATAPYIVNQTRAAVIGKAQASNGQNS